MSTKKESTEVAEVKNSAVALPDFLDIADFGAGFEGADAESYALPFLALLQKMSPMVDEDDPKYVQGAKSGMFINTVTQQLYDGKAGLLIVPAAFKRSFVKWGARNSSDPGFKGEFTPEEFDKLKQDGLALEVEGRFYAPDENGKVDDDKSDYFADTRSHFVIVVDPETGEYGQALLSLSSTAVKASRALMTALSQKKVETPRGKMTPPTFANMVRLTSVGASNASGSWSMPNFKLEGLVTDKDVYNAAKELHDAFASGAVNVDRTKQETSGEAPVSDKPEEAEGF